VNAFAGKRLSFIDVEMPYLTNEEIQLLINHEFKSERLAFVRDLFVFCCYTGLAYIDLKMLQKKHFEYSPVSKQYFIKKKRQKTKQPFITPLFPPAQKILSDRVEDWQYLNPDNFIFTVMSNQKYNSYLKEVAAFCGIEKNLTTHLARHSFATSIALENGVSLESTSKMLGHSKISQTQKYAKVTELKTERETRELFLQLS
jgi:site-specific recombinase XerD